MILPDAMQPVNTSGSAPNVTITLSAVLCHDHQRIGCEHTYTCPNCGCGQTTVPDPCEHERSD